MANLPGVTVTNLPGVGAPEPEVENDEGLTAKQELFVQRYVVHWSATKAAREAGYSETGASQIGYALLQRPKIKRRIRFAKQELFDRSEVDRDWLLERMRRMVDTDMRDVAEWGPETSERRAKDGALIVSAGVQLIPSDDLTRNASYSVMEIGNTKEGVKIKLHDKRAVMMDMAKMLGLITEKVDHSGKIETTGPDIANMTPEQLSAYEAFLIAMASKPAEG
jgi:phage terminase small subunit